MQDAMEREQEAAVAPRLSPQLMLGVLAATLNIALLVGGWVWTASKYTSSVEILQTQYKEQALINQQQTDVLNSLTRTMAVIQSDHEKYVMPHVMSK